MDTLIATSPAGLFKPTQLPWNEATPALSQTSETDSTCSPIRDYVLSPGLSAGYGAYNMSNHAGSSKVPGRSFSVASDDTVTPSFNSGATPLALVAPLSDIESCLFSEIAPTCVEPEDLVVAQEDDLQEAPIRPGVTSAPSHGKDGRKFLAQKRTHEEVRSEQPSTKTSVDFYSLSIQAIEPAPPPPVSKTKRAKKEKPSETARTPPQATGVAVAPVKKRPGRPLSTSAEARSLVRELAALHIGRIQGQNGGRPHTASAFEPTLPAFPEVSAYVNGLYDENKVRPRDDKQAKQEEDPATRSSEAERTSGRTNKIAAKKHREIIKERMQNVNCPGCVCPQYKTDIWTSVSLKT